MRTKLFRMILLVALPIWFYACSSDEDPKPEITVSGNEYMMSAEINSKVSVSFTSTFAWQAKVDATWLVASPTKGESGNASINILAKEENRTGEVRTATLTITSEGISKNITIKQDAIDVINLKSSTYNISASGGDCIIEYNTNITGAQLKLNEKDIPSWITLPQTSQRALQDGSITIKVETNRSFEERTAKLQIQAIDNNNNVLLQSPIISIVQEKASVGTSMDYVTGDKKVHVLQKHTKGNGVPLVFMGDGFLDTDIAGGYYLEVMNRGMELFFTEEPVRSLREYFDVWAVTAVSQNNAFGSGYSTKFACVLEGNGSTGISGNHDMVATYANVVPELAASPSLMDEALAIVILNTNAYAGTTFFGFTNQWGATTEFAIGYCPIIEGMDSENFRRVLCHECIGHGFTKLLDEYSYESQGVIPASTIERYKNMQQMGWAMNVDFTNNRETVLWKNFLNDTRYQGKDPNGEELGVYEGACTYWRGAYRPTNESMMRSNMHGFNAPSREAIYKRIMKLAHGNEWRYDFEEFAKFDLAHLPQSRNVNARGTTNEILPTLPSPQFVNRPLMIGSY